MTISQHSHVGHVRRCAADSAGAKRLAGSGRQATSIDVRIVRPDVLRIAEPHTLGEIWFAATVWQKAIGNGLSRQPRLSGRIS
jgi:hypothetical protein